MNQSARELMECGIQSVDIATRPEDSDAVGSTVLKAFMNNIHEVVNTGLCIC